VSNLILVLMMVFLGLSGACSSRERPQPDPPKTVKGWKDTYFSGVHSVGELFLHKGESSDNGKLGVRVLDIVAPRPGSDSEPKVVLQFYKPSDKKVLCEATFAEGGTVMGDGYHCGLDVGLSAISVNTINTKDNWVFFDLRK
jgi:hypothetical protein